MVTAIKMPKMGLSGETSLIGQWIKKKGDPVSLGEPVLTVETDKATFEVEAEAEGVLLDTFFEEGDEVEVLTPIAVIGEEGEDYSEFLNPAQPQEAAKENQTDSTNQVPIETVVAEKADHLSDGTPNHDVKISPRARKTAERLQLDYRFAVPSGAENRVMEKDVLALLNHAPRYTSAAKSAGANGEPAIAESASGLGGRVTLQDLTQPSSAKTVEQEVQIPIVDSHKDYEIQPLSRMRKVIAKNMMNSLQNTAQLTLTASFDASNILVLRSKFKQQRDRLGLENITLNDMILFAVSRTLLNHKNVNAHLVNNDLLMFHSAHLGLAVDTPKGLVVPTIFSASNLSLNEISKASKQMVQKCKEGTILPDEMQGASFTITNLGSFGIESFTPVLNPPQVGILGVGTIVERVRQVDGTITIYPAMELSLTFDHRALDGAPAARFLQELTNNLENFDLLLSK